MDDSPRPGAGWPSPSAAADDLPLRADDLPLDARPGSRALTLRDDRLDFSGFGDAAASCRRRRARLRLVDQGRFSVSQLEWLGEAGTDVYTSDRIRRTVSDLALIRKAARRGEAWVALFWHGPIDEAARADLSELGRSGLDLHGSNAEMARDFDVLAGLAGDCRDGGGHFVYQHHGAPAEGLETLAARGAWIHLTSAGLAGAAEVALAAQCGRAGRSRGAGLVLHIETRVDPDWLSDLRDAGVLFLFRTPRSDYRSPLRPFEDASAGLELPPRSYYLFPDYVL